MHAEQAKNCAAFGFFGLAHDPDHARRRLKLERHDGIVGFVRDQAEAADLV